MEEKLQKQTSRYSDRSVRDNAARDQRDHLERLKEELETMREEREELKHEAVRMRARERVRGGSASADRDSVWDCNATTQNN